MTAKEVASALSILTNDGFKCCQDWSDNCTVEAFVEEYFVFEESSDDDNNGMQEIK